MGTPPAYSRDKLWHSEGPVATRVEVASAVQLGVASRVVEPVEVAPGELAAAERAEQLPRRGFAEARAGKCASAGKGWDKGKPAGLGPTGQAAAVAAEPVGAAS